MLRIIQFQVCKPWTSMGDQCIFGLGLDGIVYMYDVTEKHWNPITTRKVNPLHKQPRKQRISIDDDKEGDGHV